MLLEPSTDLSWSVLIDLDAENSIQPSNSMIFWLPDFLMEFDQFYKGKWVSQLKMACNFCPWNTILLSPRLRTNYGPLSKLRWSSTTPVNFWSLKIEIFMFSCTSARTILMIQDLLSVLIIAFVSPERQHNAFGQTIIVNLTGLAGNNPFEIIC